VVRSLVVRSRGTDSPATSAHLPSHGAPSARARILRDTQSSPLTEHMATAHRAPTRRSPWVSRKPHKELRPCQLAGGAAFQQGRFESSFSEVVGTRFEIEHRGSFVHAQAACAETPKATRRRERCSYGARFALQKTNAPRGRTRRSRRTRSATMRPPRALPRAFGRGGGVHHVERSTRSPGRPGGTR
jgi:hypothetical protein